MQSLSFQIIFPSLSCWRITLTIPDSSVDTWLIGADRREDRKASWHKQQGKNVAWDHTKLGWNNGGVGWPQPAQGATVRVLQETSLPSIIFLLQPSLYEERVNLWDYSEPTLGPLVFREESKVWLLIWWLNTITNQWHKTCGTDASLCFHFFAIDCTSQRFLRVYCSTFQKNFLAVYL